jgi:putative tryptophan/tyrosine transport system substrate-binding protein
MKRRQFITLLSGAAAWPLAARAQQDGRVRRVGWLAIGPGTANVGQLRLNAFKRGLADLGWIEGRNLVLEERWGSNDPELLRAHAADLVALRPDAISVTTSEALAVLRRATGTIPIVFALVTDPVGQGFVSSLAQPGGNITGFASSEFALTTKGLDLLKNVAPRLARIAVVYDPQQPTAAGSLAEIDVAAKSLGVEVSRIPARNPADIERSIDDLVHTPNVGLLVLAGGTTVRNGDLIIGLTARHRLPAVYSIRYFVDGGGLASYGADQVDLCRRAASYVSRILKGEKPADLPVQLPTKFELVLNLKTAKAMGLVLSPNLLATADEVIE